VGTLYQTSFITFISLLFFQSLSFAAAPSDTIESDLANEINSSSDSSQAPVAKRAPASKPDPADFSIKTTHIEAPKLPPRSIQLLNPPHKSTYTPGLITFSWKYATSIKKSPWVFLKIERLDGKKKYAFKTRRDTRLLELSPGEYRWQVAQDQTAQESRWRLFKVIGMKSESITTLYQGQSPGQPQLRGKSLTLTRPKEDMAEEDDEDIIEEDDAQPAKVQKSKSKRIPSSLPPLSPPSWVKKSRPVESAHSR
jgi:hypothetical protein